MNERHEQPKNINYECQMLYNDKRIIFLRLFLIHKWGTSPGQEPLKLRFVSYKHSFHFFHWETNGKKGQGQNFRIFDAWARPESLQRTFLVPQSGSYNINGPLILTLILCFNREISILCIFVQTKYPYCVFIVLIYLGDFCAKEYPYCAPVLCHSSSRSENKNVRRVLNSIE